MHLLASFFIFFYYYYFVSDNTNKLEAKIIPSEKERKKKKKEIKVKANGNYLLFHGPIIICSFTVLEINRYVPFISNSFCDSFAVFFFFIFIKK